MTHIEIHKELVNTARVLVIAGEELKDDESANSIDSLLFAMIGSAHMRINDWIGVFENEPTFCGNCLWLNLDLTRKSLHRYVVIEKELPAKAKNILQSVIATLNTICIDIKKNRTTECQQVENTAYIILNPGNDENAQQN